VRNIKSSAMAARSTALATLRNDFFSFLRCNIKSGLTLGGFMLAAVMLSGCNLVVMDPKGPVGMQEKDLIILAIALMLIPVIPVILMTIGFAWQYRASNKTAKYDPDFEHSNRIEAVVWAIPCLIILALGAVTWVSTHELDPRAKIEAHETATRSKPIEIEVVSLDWKWLFIYPEYGIASVNEMALPVGTPVHFRITSATVMNSFFIPQLGSQIYAMSGMETKLNLRADHAGSYDGISANYSGFGFAAMKFKANAMSEADFEAWVAHARTSPSALDMVAYNALAKPGMTGKPVFYAKTDGELFHHILNNCTDGSICTDTAHAMAMAKNGKIDDPFCIAPPETKSESKIADATPARSTVAARKS
jgi:cytochrome o ubiquinol oxidase subunit II